MTLCISAEAYQETEPCIISCSDSRMERGGIFQELVGSEDAWKIREIGAATALLAGRETSADELLARCDKYIKDIQAVGPFPDNADILVTEFLANLRNAAAERKRDLIDHHLRMSIGMSYRNFLKLHRETFSDVHSSELWKEIQSIDLGCDVIINIFLGGPMIIRLDRYGQTHWESNYSVIGTGMDIALSFLCQHPWHDGLDLMSCLYRVYEAKRAAQANRHVGKFTPMEILFSGGRRYTLSEPGIALLQQTFEQRHELPVLGFSSDLLRSVSNMPAKPVSDGAE
jgi:hypothetical protein